MPTYEIWYDETYTYKGWFTADSEEHALELIGQVQDGEAEFDSLDDFQSKDKGYELQIELSTINLIGENK
jgi:hypothetical protein